MSLPSIRPKGLARRAGTARSPALAAIERQLGLTLSGIAMLGIVIGGVVIGRWLASRPMLLLGYGLLMLVGIGWVLGRRRIVIEVGRSKIPTRVRVGQLIEVDLSLTARRRLSTVVLEEVLPEHLGNPVRFPIPALPRGRELTCSFSFAPRRRGVYLVGPLIAEWSDPFGLTRRRVVLDDPAPLIVHPTIEAVHDRIISRAWEDPPIRPPVSKPWPSGFEFYGMRDYVPGDDPRRIVWRATARSLDLESGTGRYLVREAEQGITDLVNLFLDTDRAGHSPGETSETLEMAVRTAASLGVKHLRDGFAVSVHTNSGPLTVGLRGRRAEVELLDRLAGVEREGARLAPALDRLMLDRSRRTHNVILTPHIDRDTAMRLRLILDNGTSVLLALVLWEGTDPATLQRAGTLGCTVAEIIAGPALENAFRKALGARR